MSKTGFEPSWQQQQWWKLHAADKTRNNKLVLFDCTNDVYTDTDISTYYTDVGLGCLDYEFPRVDCVRWVMGSIKLCVSWSCSVITSLIETWYFPQMLPYLPGLRLSAWAGKMTLMVMVSRCAKMGSTEIIIYLFWILDEELPRSHKK